MRHRVLIIGGGSIGERHLRCFLHTRQAQVSLCEVHPDVRARLTAQYPIAAVSSDLQDALAAHPDVAVVCTPAHLHVSQAAACARAGAHLLIEKPLSTSLAGIDELMQLVADGRRAASVAYVHRANPMLREMRAAWQRGDFGAPLHVTVESGQHFPTYRPAYRSIYYTSRATGGGAIQDALTHLVNAVQWIVGPMTAAAADAAHLRLEGVDVEDTVNVIARHGGVMAAYSLNQHQAPNETTITIVGEEGTTRCELHRNRWLAARRPGDDWEQAGACRLERDDLFVEQARAMLAAIRGEAPVACTLEEARQTLLANLAILQAADERRWVSAGE